MANIGVNSTPKTYKSYANGYKALIDTTYKKGTDYTKGIFYKDSTSNWEDRFVEVGGIDDFAVWNDGEVPVESDIKEGFSKVMTQVPFGNRVVYGRLFNKFQATDFNVAKRGSIQLGNKAYLQQQLAPFSLLSYGFSDTNTYLSGITGATVSALVPDGKRLFSVVHPCSPTNSTTFSNALSDNAAVGEPALKAMIENLNNQLDDKGRRKHYGQEGYIWVVPLEAYPDAKRVVGSDLRAGVTDNDMNVYKGAFDGRPIEVRWVPWLSEVSTTAHFLIAKEVVDMEMPLCMLTSQEFSTDDYIDRPTGTAFIEGSMIYTVAAISGRGMVGSQGTGTGTYSA